MIPRLLAITPPVGPVATTCVEVASDLGVGLTVLLREPHSDPAALLHPQHRVAGLLRAAHRADAPVFASCAAEDAPRLAPAAREAGLRGLQLRGDPSDDALLRARAAWPQIVLGASVHGEPRAVAADYLVFAPVFPPGTDAGFAKQPRGCRPLAAWAARHPRVFALGGITPQTAPACITAGAYGLAGISTFLGARDTVTDTLRALARALTSAPDVPPSPRG